jgi:cell division protein FtsB
MGDKRPYNKPKGDISKKLVARFGLFLAIFLIIIFSVSLIRNISKIFDAKRRIKEEGEKVKALEVENEEIRRKIENVKSQEYLEKQMRDKLGLAKEGEIVVVLPDEETLRKLVPKETEERQTLPNPTWKKWLKLFF